MSETVLPEAVDSPDALPRTDYNLEAELQDLQEFVRGGSQFMNHAVWLDLEEFDARVQRILTHLPREVKRARRITREEQRILEDAKEEAGRLISEARAEAEELVAVTKAEVARMIEASAIKKAAMQQAEEIMQRAQASADELRERAFQYGRDMLAMLDKTVENAREQIHAGQQQLTPPPTSS